MLEQELQFLLEWQGTIFMHNNVPIYKVRDYLQKMTYNVSSWLLYSPDLNPIKHCWHPLKLNAQQVTPQLLQMINPKAAQCLFQEVLSNA